MTADTADPLTLRRLDRTIWALVAAVAVVVLASTFFTTFYLEWRSFAGPAAGALALCAGAWFYRHWRPDQRLASGLECTAQLVAFTAVGAPLSYLAAAAGGAFPLQDAMFEAVDRAIGLDWRGMLAWMNEHTCRPHGLHARLYELHPAGVGHGAVRWRSAAISFRSGSSCCRWRCRRWSASPSRRCSRRKGFGGSSISPPPTIRRSSPPPASCTCRSSTDCATVPSAPSPA